MENPSEAVQNNFHQHDSLLEVLPHQVWTSDLKGKLTYINELFCADLGLSPAEILEKGILAFVHPEDQLLTMDRWMVALSTEKDLKTEFRLRFADEKYYWHLCNAKLVRNEGKSIWLGTNININNQKTSEHLKDEFISIASHELKTPMTTIKAYNQMLLKQAIDERNKNFLHRSSIQIDKLEKLVNDLLDVSKINAGKLIFNMANFDFAEMLQETIISMEHLNTGHQIKLQQPITLSFFGDRFRLEQVIQNFLSNAIKYSPEQKDIHISAEISEDNLIVSVQDFGIGIAADELGKLFERYYRAENSNSRFEGLGMGLFISAEIIKRHGGSFWIESELGKGAVFSFKLPLAPYQQIVPEVREINYYKDRYITISCKENSDMMYVDWTGYQDMHSVKHGGSLMIEYLRLNKRTKVFNDNRLVPGTWSEASDWAAEIWLPLMEKAGLKYFAWILSPSAFSQLSAKKSVENEEKTAEILFFTDAQKGLDWLKALS